MPFKSTCLTLLLSLYKFTFTAASLPLLSPTVYNVTVPFKNTPMNPSLSARPPESLEISTDWDGPGFITITFSHYGADIPSDLALYCTSLALRDAWDDHRNVWNQAIGKSELLYTDIGPRRVILSVLPRAAMTWNMLYYAMRSVKQFLGGIDAIAFDYEVELAGVLGLLANGNMTVIPDFEL